MSHPTSGGQRLVLVYGNVPPTPGGPPRSIGTLGAFPLVELRPPWRRLVEEALGPPPSPTPSHYKQKQTRDTRDPSFFVTPSGVGCPKLQLLI